MDYLIDDNILEIKKHLAHASHMCLKLVSRRFNRLLEKISYSDFLEIFRGSLEYFLFHYLDRNFNKTILWGSLAPAIIEGNVAIVKYLIEKDDKFDQQYFYDHCKEYTGTPTNAIRMLKILLASHKYKFDVHCFNYLIRYNLDTQTVLKIHDLLPLRDSECFAIAMIRNDNHIDYRDLVKEDTVKYLRAAIHYKAFNVMNNMCIDIKHWAHKLDIPLLKLWIQNKQIDPDSDLGVALTELFRE